MEPERNAILIVEDEPLLREELAEMFEMQGYAAVAAADVEGALSVLRAVDRPTHVLTDFRMPGASGLDLIRTIRSEPELAEKIPLIVLMTGHSDLTAQVDIELRRHNVRLLVKPIAMAALMTIFGAVAEAHLKTGGTPPC